MDSETANNSHTKGNVTHTARCLLNNKSHKLNVDVKTFITGDDIIIKEYLKKKDINMTEKNDQRADEILKCVVRDMKFGTDQELFGIEEYWQFPFETIISEFGK